MSEPHLPTAAAPPATTLQQPCAETTANASPSEDPTLQTNLQASPPSTASGASTVCATAAKAKPVPPVKAMSAEVGHAHSQPSTCDLSSPQSGAGAPVDATIGERDRCSHPKESSPSNSEDELSDEAADLQTKELTFEFGRYIGQVDPRTGLRHGHGSQQYKSGNVYTGEWRDGAPDGFGEKRYGNGDIYRGNWRQGKRSGRGVYLFAQGDMYEGMYVDNKPEGRGTYSTPKGDRYVGQWKAGQRHGEGRETLANGQVFVGNWRNGKKQGRGQLCLPGSETCIHGIWNDDKFFRELKPNEVGEVGEGGVEGLGVQRNASVPSQTPPPTSAPRSSASIADRMRMGVTALEDGMESLGRALEKVITGGDRDENVQVVHATAVGSAGSTAEGVVVSEEHTGPAAESFVVQSQQKEEDGDGEQR
ncbi:hypothetical protein LtaPh_2006300 [Leishmania tarentolae]|uniref:MORN repeat-containing protein n=1 Tax=Leishmania tarentolae TaxID=5689 RepID=A0A640KGE0_LEITA|nr:hypothetical protein LtaPh_2006300 [Leishmania tarentolae]